MDSVVAGASDKEAAIGRQGHIVGADADGDVAQAMLSFEVDDGDVAATPIADVKIAAISAQHA